MDDWIDIRRKARASHNAALVSSAGERRADKITAAALKNDGLEANYYDQGTLYSIGVVGALDRASQIVNIQKNQSPEDEALVIAHEIGHYHVHTDPLHEVSQPNDELGGDPINAAPGKAEGYSPTERKEIQANVFADEFLCPSDWLRDEFIVRGQRPSDVAKALVLPPNRVMNQMVRALLLPPLREAVVKAAVPPIALDESQKIAATWGKGPLLVDAGPGTGKTRTLIHRVKHCLDNGSSPAAILALTFSNKAAEEMAERLSATDADAAIQMWVGTFHSFGRELITKWPSSVGRSVNVKLLDEAGTLALLEDNLEKLPLFHYQNLYEPAFELVHVLRAISRCKDELISPAAYRREAQIAYDAATDDESREKAEKALEIAGVYEVYEQLLKDADAVDFGDLVSLAISVIKNSAAARHYISQFKNVLVDEYQDVNLASSLLLQEICANGAEPWVVADQRQSIYRFRGAEPSNVTRFEADFSGTRHSLKNNYRSFAPIVRTFEAFSAAMGGRGTMAGKWLAHRAAGGRVTLTVAPDVASEAESIKQKIEEFKSLGVPYSNQVILARSHLTLSRITTVLERLGVPLLYLGDLFERSEIRDLLSLVALGSEPGSIGLPRVAALPDYQVAKEDALTLVQWSEANKISIFEALKRAAEVDGIADIGKVGLARLGAHLNGLEQASPWTLLTTWLFEKSDYLNPLLASNDANARQKLIAIYHLLKVCSEIPAGGSAGRKRFLGRIRRLEALKQDNPYRAVSSEASDIDAVRVMTIHGSKGLEFGAVHFPALAKTYMPTSTKWVRCPPPPTLPQLLLEKEDHGAEEEGLFFVGLSRAKDYLSLSRAERYTASRKSGESEFLDNIGSQVGHLTYQGSGQSFSIPYTLVPQVALPVYQERHLTLYMDCPARYRYEVVNKLRGARDDSPYILFHRCVYVTVAWLEAEHLAGRKPSASDGLTRLAAEWSARGPVGHGFESYYRSNAELMITAMCNAIATESGHYARADWTIPLKNGRVLVTPDRVLIEPSGLVRIQRTRTGRKTKSEPDKPIYALLRKGASLYHPGKPVSIEIFYLATGEVVSVTAKNDDKRLEEYEKAIAAIEMGDFKIPTTLPQSCPNCPAYFTCGVQ